VIGESDPSLMRYAGLAVSGELARRLGLVELIDAELAVERRARPVKVRRRGLTPGQLMVAVSECQLVGGEFFSDLEQVRADEAGAGLRTVGRTPSAPTALQRAKDFRRVHCQRVERACARVGGHLDRALGRDPIEPATVDLDATGVRLVWRLLWSGALRQSELGGQDGGEGSPVTPWWPKLCTVNRPAGPRSRSADRPRTAAPAPAPSARRGNG
jgi:hypothetical protein